MNRGRQPIPELQGMQDQASMRPRFMNRGRSRLVSAALSWRARFNEAPIHESGKVSLNDARTATYSQLQ